MSKEKEMADEIFSKFKKSEFDNGTLSLDDWDAKHCALIHVNGIIEEYELIAPVYERKKFWEKVKQEIEKL